MASDSLRLLFELDVDSRAGTAGLLRFRKDIAATIEGVRRAITQPLKTLNTASITAATAKVSASTQELANRQARAAQAAQRLQIGQQRLTVSSTQVAAAQQRAATAVQRAANGQTQAAAGAIRAATAYQRATVAANSFAQSQNAVSRALASVQSGLRSVGSGLQSAGRSLTVGITAPLLALGAASLKSAKDIDANVNTLKAFTGSAEAAERRLAQLIKTARATPGLTTNLGLILDAQLRTAQVTQEAIDKVLPAIGRLNAVSRLQDPARFTQNLVQLITQNFERQDLKELVGQSPLAGQLITEIFNVDSPINAKAIKTAAAKMGIDTVEELFTAIADAAAKNQGLANVTESIGTRFDKIVDRVTVALRPLGLAILSAIEPFVEPVARLIERLGAAFDSLSQPVKTAIIIIAGIAAAAGPVLFVLGGLTTAIAGVISVLGAIGAAVAAIGLPALVAVIAGLVIVIAEWAAILGVLGLAWKTNFLNIQGLVTDAAGAVINAFNKVKIVIQDIVERILPTLESITNKIIGGITAVWEQYGKRIVKIVGDAFAFIVDVTTTFLQQFGNFVDFVLKLIDGDWQGAWRAFSRFVVTAVDAIPRILLRLHRIVANALRALISFILTQAVRLADAATELAAKFISALAREIILGAPKIRDALADLFLLAIASVNTTGLASLLIQRFLAALRKAAGEGVPTVGADVSFGAGIFRRNVGGEPVIGAGVLRKKKPGDGTGGADAGKGEDAETRRRIRLLELEAEKAEAIARQRIAAENILFEQRKTSLKNFTDFQLREEEIVLAKKREVFAAERKEAEKLKKGKDLALGEIRLKELRAELEFADKRNQLLANQEREELEAAKAHRQALLDIQEQADAAEIARLEDLQRQGHVTAFDVASRQAQIEADARVRRRADLELQLKEAGENAEKRKEIIDELAKFDAESAESVKRNERLKRIAVQETADAYRDYTLAINEALEVAADARRNAAIVALTRLNARALLTQQQRIEAQFAIDRSLLEAEKRASDLRIDNAEREAIEKAKKAGDYEEKALQIERTFNAQRLAEQERFNQERRKLAEDLKAELERANPNSTRSLFGDTFADFGQAIRAAADAAGVAISNLQVTLGSFGAAAAEHFANASASAGNFISILLDGISQINAGLGDMLANWILTGEAGSGALRKLLASTLAYYSRTFLIKALDNVGEGFSNLAKAAAAAAAGNLASAALYKTAAVQNFISAAKYGLAAAGTAVAGRLAAGDSFNQKDTARRAVNGGEDPEPRNRTFDGGLVQPSSQAAREGSGGIFGNALARIESLQQQNMDMQRQLMLVQGQTAQALTRIQSMRHGDALAIGAAENPSAVGQAVVNHSNSSGDFNETLQRNLGFAR